MFLFFVSPAPIVYFLWSVFCHISISKGLYSIFICGAYEAVSENNAFFEYCLDSITILLQSYRNEETSRMKTYSRL